MTALFSGLCIALPGLGLAEPAVQALPSGGSIMAGSGRIATNGNAMTVTQNTDKLITNWQSFNIGANASVQFLQPNASSIALNRVLGQNPSEIFGRLSANGQVMLVNPSGIVFGVGSQVNANALVASTLQISDQNFLAGNYRLVNEGSPGGLQNQGSITGHVVALVAPVIENTGKIDSPNGSTLLAAANKVTLDFHGDGVLRYTLDEGAANALISNRGDIRAAGGQVVFSAKALDAATRSAINNSGLIEANSLVAKGGRIILEADDITLDSGSRLEAKGASGGGEVLVGGGWQGSGGIRQAISVNMDAGASIDVSATKAGDGGTAVLWSDVTNAESVTSAHGAIKAEGGVEGGNGGRIETSGHALKIDSLHVSTMAQKGKSGEWLLDPYNITISSSTDATTSNAGGSFTASADGTSVVNVNTLLTALESTAVTVSTTGAGNDAGNITVASAIDDSGLTNRTNKLTLNAANGIVLNVKEQQLQTSLCLASAKASAVDRHVF